MTETAAKDDNATEPSTKSDVHREGYVDNDSNESSGAIDENTIHIDNRGGITNDANNTSESVECCPEQAEGKQEGSADKTPVVADKGKTGDGKTGAKSDPELAEVISSNAASDTSKDDTSKSSSEMSVEKSTNSDSVASDEKIGSTVLREEGVGEVAKTKVGKNSGEEPSSILDDLYDNDRKHDDPQAEYAHRKAQQRDPREVVELGEIISLVIKEADFTSGLPTVMGTKNNLVVFVTEPPRHLSKYDTIRAKIVDFGGKDTSAEAVFLGYDE